MKTIHYILFALIAGHLIRFAHGQEIENDAPEGFTPMVFEISSYDAQLSEGESMKIKGVDSQGYFVFRTPVPVLEVAKHYIRYFMEDGWQKLGDYPFLRTTNEGDDWGGVYGKDDFIVAISCHGSWNFGVLTKDGEIKSYTANGIHIQVLRGDPKVLFGGDPTTMHAVSAIEDYLEEWVSTDPNSLIRYQNDQVTPSTGRKAYKAYLEKFEAILSFERTSAELGEDIQPQSFVDRMMEKGSRREGKKESGQNDVEVGDGTE
ncbi:MAG: hypothetical protein JJU29_09875 [Verrucomicrobia bacterium]|nr:hypothetical protein [Verrucomicrobiota bacterium]MCH8511599.1 hypothetical protein [Kiritimatiellia bacterium]